MKAEDIKVGNVLKDTEGYGTVSVKDICISPTSGLKLFVLEPEEGGWPYYASAEDLTFMEDV